MATVWMRTSGVKDLFPGTQSCAGLLQGAGPLTVRMPALPPAPAFPPSGSVCLKPFQGALHCILSHQCSCVPVLSEAEQQERKRWISWSSWFPKGAVYAVPFLTGWNPCTQLGLRGLPHPHTVRGNLQKHLQWPRKIIEIRESEFRRSSVLAVTEAACGMLLLKAGAGGDLRSSGNPRVLRALLHNDDSLHPGLEENWATVTVPSLARGYLHGTKTL